MGVIWTESASKWQTSIVASIRDMWLKLVRFWDFFLHVFSRETAGCPLDAIEKQRVAFKRKNDTHNNVAISFCCTIFSFPVTALWRLEDFICQRFFTDAKFYKAFLLQDVNDNASSKLSSSAENQVACKDAIALGRKFSGKFRQHFSDRLRSRIREPICMVFTSVEYCSLPSSHVS